MAHRLARWVLGSMLALALSGCEGLASYAASSSSPDEAPTLASAEQPVGWVVPPLPGDCADLAPTRVRLLSNSQLDATVQAVFPGAPSLAAGLPAEIRVDGYTENEARELSSLHLDHLDVRAGEVASAVVGQLEGSLGCTSRETELACVDRTLARVGGQLWRRALTSAERTELTALYAAGRAGATRAEGLTLALQGLLAAPSLLYRQEAGVVRGDRRVLTGPEIAQRLAYELTDAPPDDALTALGVAGSLEDPAIRVREADRLLSGPKGRARLSRFGAEWLGVDGLPGLTREAARFPQFNDALRESMVAETRQFFAEVLSGPAPTTQSLWGADYTWADERLASFYGVTSPGVGLQRVSLVGTERRGMLGQAGFLLSHSQDTQTSPIRRGVAVRKRALCLPLPPPPPNIPPITSSPDEPRTTRERFAQHTSTPACSGCHSLIDPPGFALEGFDAIGAARTTENGHPVDTRAELSGALDASGWISGAADLASKLAGSQIAAECAVHQLATFSLGRVPIEADKCGVQTALHRSLSRGGDLREAIRGLVASASYIERSPTP